MPESIIVSPGDRYGRFTIIKESLRKSLRRRRFECRCECGSIRSVNLEDLRGGHLTSCGCPNWNEAEEVPPITDASQLDLAWSAGFVDGEGCIHIRINMPTSTSKQRSPHFALILQVVNTNRPSLEKLQSIFKCGSIREHHASDVPARSAAYAWYCMSLHANRVIALLLPYLVVKRAEAEVALEFYKLPPGRRGSKTIDMDLLSRRAELCDKLRSMKGTFKYNNHRWKGSAVLSAVKAQSSSDKSDLSSERKHDIQKPSSVRS